MSKMDALRAMREARFEAAAKGTRSAAPARVKVTATTPAPRKPAPVHQEGAAEALCGHKSMNGRTCTRERGHAAKSHRYS